MKFYDKFFENNYEELIQYYPRYYRDVLEMDAILRANGDIADELEDSIEQTYFNNFIDYADEETIRRLEKFLTISIDKSKSLDERRRLVKSFFVGFGKVSASMLEEMIASYTGAPAWSVFEPRGGAGDTGDSIYKINFYRGNNDTIRWSDIYFLLGRKLPAHVSYEAALTFRFPIGIGFKRTWARPQYELCGTKPETVLKGEIQAVEAGTQARALNCGTNYLFCGTQAAHS